MADLSNSKNVGEEDKRNVGNDGYEIVEMFPCVMKSMEQEYRDTDGPYLYECQ
jgi:hypothetical protein